MSEYTFYSRTLMFGRIAGGHLQVRAILYEVKGAPPGQDGKPVLKPTGIVSLWVLNKQNPSPGTTTFVGSDGVTTYKTFDEAKAKWLEDLAAGRSETKRRAPRGALLHSGRGSSACCFCI